MYAGGDCTNFASQIVHEGGGLSKTADWDISGNIVANHTWLVANDFAEYFSNVRGYNGGLWYTREQINSKAYPGDCIAYMRRSNGTIYHIAFVQSKVNGYVYLSQHSDSFYNIKFNDRISESKMNANYIIILNFSGPH